MSTPEKGHKPIQTLPEIAGLCEAGDPFLVSIQTSELLFQLLPPITHSFQEIGEVHLFSTGNRISPPDSASSIHPVDFLAAKTAQKRSALVRKETAKASRKAIFVFDIAPAWTGSSQSFLNFFQKTSRFLKSKRLRNVWLLSEDSMSGSIVSRLRSESPLFLRLWVPANKRELWAQLLSIRGIIDADAFLPRQVTVESKQLVLREIVTPSQISTEEIPASIGRTSPAITVNTYERLFTQSVQGVVFFDLKGSYRKGNRRAWEILGYGEEELRTVPLSSILDPAGKTRVLRSLITLAQKRKVSVESTFRRKNGRRLQLAIDAFVIADRLYACTFRDITDSTKEESEQEQLTREFTRMYEDSPYAQAIFVDRKLVLHNSNFQKAFPWIDLTSPNLTLTSMLGKQNAGTAKELFGLMGNPNGNNGSARGTIHFQSPEHGQRQFEVSAQQVELKGRRGLHCTFVDITERTALLANLSQSEESLRTVIENSPGCIAVIENDRMLFANRSFLNLLGYSDPGEMPASGFAGTVSRKDRTRVMEALQVEGLRSASSHIEYSGQHKDGTPVDIEADVVPERWGGKKVAILYARDFSSVRSENNRRRSATEAFEMLLDLDLALTGTLELPELLREGLRSLLRGLHCEFGAVHLLDKEGKTLLLAHHEGLPERISTELGTQSTQEGLYGYVAKTEDPLLLNLAEYPPHLPYRSLFESEGIRFAACIPCVAHEKLTAILLVATRKGKPVAAGQIAILGSVGKRFGIGISNSRAHQSLHESENRYRMAVENLPDVVYIASATGHTAYISPNVEGLLNHKPTDFYRSPELWRTLLHPDDRAMYSQRISSSVPGVDRFTLEYRILPKGKAAYRWVRDSVHYAVDADGNLLSITGIVTDVTEQKRLEDGLMKSESLKASVLQSLREGVVVYDLDLRCIEWNTSMEQISGIPRDRIVGKLAGEEGSEFTGTILGPMLQRGLLGEFVSSEDLPIRHITGDDQSFYWVRCFPLRDHSGSTRGVVAVFTDVTARRALERNIRESEETLRNVIDGMGDALMICDLQGRVWEVNREFSRLTAFPRGEVLGMTFPYPWLVDEEMSRFVTWIAELREKNFLRDFDMSWHSRDGRTVAISLNTSLLRNAVGEPVAMLNIARDISDRKRLVTELERKTTQIELLNRIIGKANATMNFEEIFNTVAREVHTLVPYDQISVGLLSEDGKEVVNFASVGPAAWTREVGARCPVEQTVAQLAIRTGRAAIVDDLATHTLPVSPQSLVEHDLPSHITIPIWLNEEILGSLNLAAAHANAFSGVDLESMQPIADQIGAVIDRVRLFERVRDDGAYIHNLLNSIHSVVYTVDVQYRITAVNKAWRDFALLQGLNHLQDESLLIGKPLKEIVQDASLWKSYEQVMPKLLQRTLDYYSAEFDLREAREKRTYQVTINPMVVGQKVTGLVFTSTDITRVTRTEEEIRQRNRELVALNTISRSITQSLHLDDVLQVAGEQIKDILNAAVVLIYLNDRQAGRLRLGLSLGLSNQFASRIRYLDVAKSATGTVIAEDRPLLINKELLRDKRISGEGREVFEAIGLQSLGVIPLRSKERVLGALDVAFQQEHEFGEKEQQFLMLIGSQLGSAIENAQLYAEVRNQVRRLTSLYEVGRGLAGTLDVQTILQIVHAEIGKAIPLDQFTYYALSPDRTMMSPVLDIAGGDPETRPLITAETPVEADNPLGRAISMGSSILVESPHEFPRCGSMILIPVRSEQEISGLLVVCHSVPGTYDEAHLRLLESIGNLTEIALDKASLYVDIVNTSKEIESRNKELDDFTYVVSHDLKEPLISIEAYSKILSNEYGDKIDLDGREYLSAVVQSSIRLKTLIDDLLTLSRLGRVSDTAQILSMDIIVEDVLHDLQFALKERNVTVNVEKPLPEVKFSATQLGIVFRNLISNAIKFNTDPNPQITISATRGAGEYIVSVSDNGIGIDPQYFEKIFMIFQRLHRTEEYRGTGAGLTIVKKIVENHHGHVWVESAMGKGSKFSFTIPD